MEKVIKLESGRYGILVNLEGNEEEELIYKNGEYYLPIEEDFTVKDNAGDNGKVMYILVFYK